MTTKQSTQLWQLTLAFTLLSGGTILLKPNILQFFNFEIEIGP